MDKRLCIYPRYINSGVKQCDGRRIGKEFCPLNPTCQEIEQHLKKLYQDTKVEIEDKKRFPRSAVESFDIGRVRIDKIEGVDKYQMLKAVAMSILNEKQAAQAKIVVSKQQATKSKKK